VPTGCASGFRVSGQQLMVQQVMVQGLGLRGKDLDLCIFTVLGSGGLRDEGSDYWV